MTIENRTDAPESPRELRARLGITIKTVAFKTASAEATLRIYDADRLRVSPAKRQVIDSYYEGLRKRGKAGG